MSGSDEALRLAVVATWHEDAATRAAAELAEVAGAMPSWRTRVDAVGRALEDAECWSGPAATQAAAGVLRVSAVAAALDPALDASLEEVQRLARAAIRAAEDARAAMALSRAAGIPLAAALGEHDRLADVVGRLVPGTAVPPGPAVAAARDALAAADEVRRAATAAAQPLQPFSAVDLPTPADVPAFDALAVAVPTAAAVLPGTGDPAAVARWWAGLPAGAHRSLLETRPTEVGALDGVPAWARDRANRLLLERALDDRSLGEDERETAEMVARVLHAEEEAGRPAQLQLLDLADGRAAVAFGDLDTAGAVALLVPGMGISAGDDLHRVAGDARDVAAAAVAAAPGAAVAAVAWIGYRAPHDPLRVIGRSAAARGGALLAGALDGLTAARTAAGVAPARTTVLAHSYGTVVVDEAADRPGELAADAVVLLGSPGTGGDADALEVAEVYDAASIADPISWAGWFGPPTWSPAFGSEGLPVSFGTGHSEYYDRDRPTLAAMGEVVAGRG